MFGEEFIIKLLEKEEDKTILEYKRNLHNYPILSKLIEDEMLHEKILQSKIRSERLNYIGSMILGINDAIVELTGSLFGVASATSNSTITAVTGLIIGIAAALSMTASEYLSRRAEGYKNPIKAAIYTGLSYISVVIILITSFFVFPLRISLLLTIVTITLIILLFSWITSIIHDRSFKEEAIAMLTVSIGTAMISYIVGELAKKVLNIQI